jgi:hypothetical protein
MQVAFFDSVEDLFKRVYFGEITTLQAHTMLHYQCSVFGLNPTVEMPLSNLMKTEQGQVRLFNYEKFIASTNWMIASLATKQKSADEIVDLLKERIESMV